MCKWVFNQITQMSGAFHFPIKSNVRVYRRWSVFSGCPLGSGPRRGTKRKVQMGQCCFFFFFPCSEEAPCALSCTWPCADLLRGGQDQAVSWGEPQGHPSTSRRMQASELPRRQGREVPSDDSTPDTDTLARGRFRLRKWGHLSVVTLLDNLPYIVSQKINLGHSYQPRTQS